MTTTDYSDWIITIPLATAKQLFPSFSDGVNVAASVVKFNAMLLDKVQEVYAGSWVNQERRIGYDVSTPDGLNLSEGNVVGELSRCWLEVYDAGDWYVT
jgi:hypothetical protein